MSDDLDDGIKDGLAVDQQKQAEKRAAADKAEPADQYIDALLVEREGYARFGRDDRVADVDAELQRRGYKAAAQDRAAAAPKTPRGRRTATHQEG